MKRRKWLLLILLLLAVVYGFILPRPLFQKSYSTVLLSSQGGLLGARLAADEQWRFPLPDSIPGKFEACLLQQEDQYFYYHPGFNPVSLFRALWLNVQQGRVVSGGSTISMQLIRLSRNNPPRTVLEKVYEIILATRLELAYSKAEILKMYATHAPFGGNVVGFETAAWRYFSRGAAQLSWAESATLAVLPNAPGLIHPGRNRQTLEVKRNELLHKLKNQGLISESDYKLALLESVPQQPAHLPNKAFHLSELIHNRFPGKRIKSSLDENLQQRATQMVNAYVQDLQANKINNAALLLIDNQSAELKAYVGNASSGKEHFNDMLQTPRSSGSILKPFLYAAMLQSGELLPAQLLPDVPTFIGSFQPKNFEDEYDGAVPANEALVRSLNVPAVHALKAFSTERMLRVLHQLRFTSFNAPASHYGLSLILGGGEVTAWDLGQAYYQMAAVLNKTEGEGPEKIKPAGFQSGDSLIPAPPLHPGAIWQTLHVLKDLNRPQSESGWEKFGGSNISWKTGTSFGFRDAWAVGLSPRYTCVVWVGNATGEGRPGIIGAEAAGPLLFNFMNSLPRQEAFAKPWNFFEEKIICQKSGLVAGMHCPDTVHEFVPRGGQQQALCTYHQEIFTDKSGAFRLNRSCHSDSLIRHKWFVLPPVQAWFYAQINPDYQPLPKWKAGCGQENEALLEVIYPRPGGKIFIPRELGGESSKVVVEVAHQNRDALLFWHLNGEYLGESRLFHEKALELPAGEYKLLIEDEKGNYCSRNFSVMQEPGK